MNKKQATAYAKKALRYYQPLLNLSDWNVSIEVLTEAEYTYKLGNNMADTSQACTYVNILHKEANISLRLEEQPLSMVENLIHELVHLLVHEQYVHTGRMVDNLKDSLKECYTTLNNYYLEVTVIAVAKAMTHQLKKLGGYKTNF